VQPLDLGDDERLVGGVLERFAPPEPESFTDGAERVVGARPAGLFQVAAGRCDQALESEQVDGLGGNVEHVAASHRSQSRNVPIGGKPERPSEVRDVHLKRVGGVRREMLAPHLVDQHLGRDRAAGPQEQRDQHRPWAASAEWDDGPGTPYFQRPEESELQVHRTPA
jgi:hypothetical protein